MTPLKAVNIATHIHNVTWLLKASHSPTNRDEVFSLHGDAPGEAFLGLCTHSHRGLHNTLLHPTGPLPYATNTQTTAFRQEAWQAKTVDLKTPFSTISADELRRCPWVLLKKRDTDGDRLHPSSILTSSWSQHSPHQQNHFRMIHVPFNTQRFIWNNYEVKLIWLINWKCYSRWVLWGWDWALRGGRTHRPFQCRGTQWTKRPLEGFRQQVLKSSFYYYCY